MTEYELICCVVSNGQGSKALRIARNSGVAGGTVFIGHGTVRSKLLEFLDLNDVRKEVILMAAQRDTARAAVRALDAGMSFGKPRHGIAFTVPLTSFAGSVDANHGNDNNDRMVTETMYSAIFTVVDRGRGVDVVDAAKAAGARGATIIHARGSGIHETDVLFAMPVEPEKDMVMILAKNDIRDDILASIRNRLQIDKPGAGIVFTLAANDAYGLY